MRSMTGYGRYEAKNETYLVGVELRSVNSRYFESYLKMSPRNFGDLEFKLANLLKMRLVRGKVNATLHIEALNKDSDEKIDFEQVLAYHKALEAFSLENSLSYDGKIEALLTLPNVIKLSETSLDEAIENFLLDVFNEALDFLYKEQLREGSAIKQDILDKLARLDEIVGLLKKENTELLHDYEKRLRTRIEKLVSDSYAEDRILAEVAILAEKATIDEEVTRLFSHLSAFRGMLDEAVVGRKLDFMLQEMNREINTVGSKIQTVALSQYVVEVKGILENIREQVQNIV